MTGSLRSQALKLPMTAAKKIQILIINHTYTENENPITLLLIKSHISSLLVSKLEA